MNPLLCMSAAPDYVTDQAKLYGLDLDTARIDVDGVWRADCCPPMEGHWEFTNDKGWVHIPPARKSIGDLWASGRL